MQQFSLACVCDSEKLTGDTTHAVRTIVSVIPRKADLMSSVKLTYLFVKPLARESLIPQDLSKLCSSSRAIVREYNCVNEIYRE